MGEEVIKPHIPLPRERWTKQEQFVFECARTGRTANFNKQDGYGGTMDQHDDEVWKDDNPNASKRIIRPEFLITILSCKKYRDNIFKNGVQIKGAWFKDEIGLFRIDIPFDLKMDDCRFDNNIELFDFKTDRSLLFINSAIRGSLKMHRGKIGAGLFLRKKLTLKGNLEFRGSSIGGQLDASGSTFEQNVSLDSVKIDGDLFMSAYEDEKTGSLTPATFKGIVDMRGVSIGGQFAMNSSTFEQNVSLNSVKIDGSLFMRAYEDEKTGSLTPATFKGKVDMLRVSIGGQLSASGSTFSKKIAFENVSTGTSLFFGDINATATENEKYISAAFFACRIWDDFHIANTWFAELNLTGSRIDGEFRLGLPGNSHVHWKEGAKCVLRNVTADCVQDTAVCWESSKEDERQSPLPKKKTILRPKLELDGFSYNRLGGLLAGTDTMATRGVEWIKGWLDLQEHYSPQPYEQLAKVLSAAGHKEMANELIFTAKEKQRKAQPRLTRQFAFVNLARVKASFEYTFIGYGFRLRHAMAWSVLLLVFGMIALAFGAAESPGWVDCLIYSGVKLFPLFKLSGAKEFTLAVPAAELYFFVHGFMGYVLGIFVAAGFTGFMRKLT